MAKVELLVPVAAAAGKAQELKKELQALLAPTREEKGCHFYRLYESETEGNFFFHELWEDQAALDAHMKAPHFEQVVKKTEGLLAMPLAINKVKELS